MPIRFRNQPQFDPETLALRVLAHIAMDETLMPRFLTLSGLDRATSKARAADPALLGGVLDFVLFDDSLVLQLAETLARSSPRPSPRPGRGYRVGGAGTASEVAVASFSAVGFNQQPLGPQVRLRRAARPRAPGSR